MDVTIWINEKHLDEFKKFYDDVNEGKIIEKENVPKILFKTQRPKQGEYLQVNVYYEIFQIMKLSMNNKNEE